VNLKQEPGGFKIFATSYHQKESSPKAKLIHLSFLIHFFLLTLLKFNSNLTLVNFNFILKKKITCYFFGFQWLKPMYSLLVTGVCFEILDLWTLIKNLYCSYDSKLTECV